ncbi:MAG: SurA N-terminal domain-containing protein [Porticoccaceae bacterium]|nr:SurA N-terminal domain-containing protein [Porticoccaceae bacterium]
MLDDFRSGMRGIALVIVGFIAIIFTFSGIGSLSMTGVGSGAAASIDGDAITEQDVALELQLTKSRILSENQGLRTDQLDDQMLRPGVVERLIANKALSQSADNSGMAVAATAVSQILLDAESFQTDGVFDEDRYRYFIRERGLTNAQFKLQLEDDILRGQVVAGYRQSTFITHRELQRLAEVVDQARDYYYLSVPLAPILDAVEVPREILRAYYDQHLSEFESEEQVVLDYIELSADLLVLDEPISDTDVLRRFNEESGSAVSSTSRRVAHILLDQTDETAIAEIMANISAGTEFAELAKEYSTDVGSAARGGDLGFTDGSMFPENFEIALAALEVGAVSPPVKTESGVHLIKLLDIDQSTFELEIESERIASQLRRERRDVLLVDKLAKLRELSYNAESLAEIAVEVGLSASVSEPLSRFGGAGIGGIPDIIEVAFSEQVLVDGYASEVLALDEDRYIVVKLQEHILADQKPFDEVSEEVLSAYVAVRAGDLIRQRGAQLMARVEAGESVEEVAKAESLEWQVVLDVRRSAASVNTEINEFAFSLLSAEDPVNASFIDSAGDLILISLQRTAAGDYASLKATDQRALKDAVLVAAANREVSAFQQALVENASVIR